MRDLANYLHPVRAIAPAAAVADNTPIVSSIVSLAGYSSLAFLLALGGIADADATFTVLVEDGDQANLSDAAPVPDAKLTGLETDAGFTFADDNELRKIGYVGSKSYVRLTITPVNNTGNVFVSAIAVLGDGRFGPTPSLA
jgi:hypothetical protein